jgi:hypothetical protein
VPFQLDCTDLDAPSDQRVPRPHRARAGQHHPQPQRPPGRDPLPVQLRASAPPEHAADIERVLAIPPKRADQTIVTFLTAIETEIWLVSPGMA